MDADTSSAVELHLSMVMFASSMWPTEVDGMAILKNGLQFPAGVSFLIIETEGLRSLDVAAKTVNGLTANVSGDVVLILTSVNGSG